jgi:hypothetical protein
LFDFYFVNYHIYGATQNMWPKGTTWKKQSVSQNQYHPRNHPWRHRPRSRMSNPNHRHHHQLSLPVNPAKGNPSPSSMWHHLTRGMALQAATEPVLRQ